MYFGTIKRSEDAVSFASDPLNIITEEMGALGPRERSVALNSWSETIKIHLPRMVIESTINATWVKILVGGCVIFC